MAPKDAEQDHIDRFLERIAPALPDLDLEVEGIVDRISGLSKRLQRSMDETLAEFGLDHMEYKVLGALSQAGEPYRSTPGRLAKRMELSSGAVTNRLDRMEEAGLIRRLPDPNDRRGVVVELTEQGQTTYTNAVGVQAKKEALVAGALDEREKQRLNALLRKMMIEFERSEATRPRP
jgi:DNA-binding MarR family transcriptional regulator